MKVKTKDLEFNPFRNISLVPIDRITVDKLKSSITDLGLWSGMSARPKNNDWDCGKYEIPFGHHRLVAIRELGIDEIDIPISEIADSIMVLMMVQENMTQRGVSVEMINGTVMEVKAYLDGELAKYESWETFNDFIRGLFDTQRAFETTKGSGVGQTTILKFLKGAIPQWRIAAALTIINSSDIDMDAVNQLNSTGQQSGFTNSIRKINKERMKNGMPPIPKEDQKEIARKIKEIPVIGKTGGGNYYKSMEGMIRQRVDGTDEFTMKLNELKTELETIDTDSKRLASKISAINGKFMEMGVKDVKSLASYVTINELSKLTTSVFVLAEYLGIKIPNQIQNE